MQDNSEIVVLLHGIGRTYRCMRVLEKSLEKEGYRVLNIDYPSRKKNIQTLAQEIYPQIQPYLNQDIFKIHFVTHSMGGLIVRELLAQSPIHNVGKVVMLAPPHHGSEVADFLQLRLNFLFKRIYGPSGQQLTTRAAADYPLPPITFDLGIIAGDLCIDPFCYLLLPKGHDGKVTIQSTLYEGMKEHLILRASHTFIMYNKKVINQVVYFLKKGKFYHPL